ncbi:transcription factor MYB118-like [Amaranthus tricolor]|uniref:transcription factor MYB118-like n=1 Tax=Amaranthus tricolor TaxID=29722 RepID=UPI00258D0A3D|nr:transcription factor MYB118-like [Amaranthus tricolor]
MDFDAKYKQNFSSSLPLFFNETNSKSRDERVFLEGASCYDLQEFHHVENFNMNLIVSSSNTNLNPLFEIQQNDLDSYENSPFGLFPNYDFYETKPFVDHVTNDGGLVPLLENFNQNGGNLGNSHMINQGSQSYNNPFNYCDYGFRPSDEDSSVTPKTTVRKQRRSRKKTSVVKGQWTTEEDRLLNQLVERHGVRKWSQIAQLLNGRIGKQCRERWHNHLRPDIKKDVWTEEEDRILIKAHAEIGNKWAEIAKKLPGRTENSIKNHWNATKRRQFSKRKCRTKYPRKSSLLEEYIKSLTPETINAGCRKKPTSSMKNEANSSKQQIESSNSSSSDQVRLEHDFGEVPDFDFNAQMFEEGSLDSILDCYDDPQHGHKLNEVMNHPHDSLSSLRQFGEKRELDLMEMINQVNI